MIDFSKLLEEDAKGMSSSIIQPSEELACLLSIAISTKRIADTLGQLVVHSPYGRPQLNTGNID